MKAISLSDSPVVKHEEGASIFLLTTTADISFVFWLTVKRVEAKSENENPLKMNL